MSNDAAGALLFLAVVGFVLLSLTYGVVKGLYRRHLFWKYVRQDPDVGDPLKLFRLYHAQNTERGGEHRNQK